MLKRFLAVTLACFMILSSMAVVSFADTNTEPQVIQEWVEDFDGYTDNQFVTTDPNTLYKDNKQSCHGKKHLHLSDDWIIWDAGNYNGTGTAFTSNYYSIEEAIKGKENGSKNLVSKEGITRNNNTYISNSFGGSPVDVSTGKAVGFSFDWYSNSTQNANAHLTFVPFVQVIADFTDGTTTHKNVTFTVSSFYGYNVRNGAGTTFARVPSVESWNPFDVIISKDTIKYRYSSYAEPVTVEVDDYNPEDGKYVSNSNESGFEISNISTVRIYNLVQRASHNYRHGFDNLNLRTYSSMPSDIKARAYANYTDFSAIYKLSKKVEGDGGTFDIVDGVGNNLNVFQKSETTVAGDLISMDILNDDGKVKNTKTKFLTDGYLKISNTEGTYIDGSPLCYIKNDTLATPRANIGDKVQYSYDFKFEGNENASSNSSLLELSAKFVTGVGEIIYISGNGTVYNPANTSESLAKLKADTWYSVDTISELTSEGTVVNVYLDGKHILTKTLTGEYKPAVSGIGSAVLLTYRCIANAEKTGYLENAVCFDNLCYQIFKGGANVFNFDKSASTASNAAIANADVDFVNSTIFPVSADFTVADFYALGLVNAVVTDENGAELTVASDGDKVLAGNKIKFSGDYGKDVYYTVSSQGGANVTKESFVTIRENLGANLATSATAGNLLTAKAVKDGAELEVYIAEYSNNELVGLTVGEGVANYTPKKAGNTIKVLIWNEGELVPVFTGAASQLNVN